jgi:hypothetical protein
MGGDDSLRPYLPLAITRNSSMTGRHRRSLVPRCGGSDLQRAREGPTFVAIHICWIKQFADRADRRAKLPPVSAPAVDR